MVNRSQPSLTNRSLARKEMTWQARIKITQVPAEIENQIVRHHEKNKEVSIRKTFLTNPFSDGSVYGMELALKNEFIWTYFFPEYTKKRALMKANTYLLKLQDMYPGLRGEVFVVPTYSLRIDDRSELYELVMPNKPMKFNIVEKIIQLFKKEKIGDIRFYFFWQRDDSISKAGWRFNGIFNNYSCINCGYNIFNVVR